MLMKKKVIFWLSCFIVFIGMTAYAGPWYGGGSGSSTINDADADGAADLANYLKSVATSGKISITGPAAGSTRAKTLRDADDTILELGGSYTPTGTWVWTSATGTWPTFNQNTTGTAANLSAVLSPTLGGTGVANDVASTITIAGAFGLTITITADRDLNIPISGTAVVTTEAITAGHVIRKADSGEGYVDAGLAIEATDGLTFHFSNSAGIAAGVRTCMMAKFAIDLDSWYIASVDADTTSGSIVIDIWKDTHANYPPTVDDTITASAKPTLSSAVVNQDTTLTGWTKTVAKGDWVCAKVDSATTVTDVHLSITGTRK
jgi:hypothetical protein